MLGGTSAAAQTTPDDPIVTGAQDAPPDLGPASASPREASPGQGAEAPPRPALAADAPRAVRRPAPARPPAQRTALQGADEPGELMEFGRNTSLVLRRVATPGVTGGLLQANPHLEKRQRRQLGLALRF